MYNITTFLQNRASEFPDKQAIIHPSRSSRYTRSELYHAVCCVSSGLKKRGVERGDRIVLFLDSSAEYLISILAIWHIGAVAVPSNIAYREEELTYVMMDSGAEWIITDQKGKETARLAAEKTGNIGLIMVGEPGPDSWETLRESPPLFSSQPCRSDDLCQIQYTSGTTGKPKGAMLTHGGWMAAFDAEREALDLTNDDIYLGIYPMGHVGISWGLAVLKEGGLWIIMERYHLEEYLHLANEYKATILAGMPPVIHAITESEPGTERKLSTVRRIISGGGPMHAATWRSFHHRFQIPVINAYGLSETIVLGAGTAIRPDDYQTADEYLSVGRAIGYAEVKIVNEADPKEALSQLSHGEIALRGPGVAIGYWNKPDDSSAVFLPDGWFLTGDIGYIDKNGMLVITDRKKDMIIMSGWKVYPTEVENALILHPDIVDIAIFGLPDEEKGEIPVAAVVPREGTTITHDELVRFAKEHLAGYKIPRKTCIVPELPRVGGWKLLRRNLREQFSP